MVRFEGTPGRDILFATPSEDEIYGLEGNDVLRGRAGDDLIDGGTGGDLMIGRTGNDVYHVDDVGDRVGERFGEGIDTVIVAIIVRLQKEIENLVLTGDARAGAGNDLDNRITADQGESVNNILNGGGGADFMARQFGNDIYIVDNADDMVEEFFGFGEIDAVFADVSYRLPDLTTTGEVNHLEALILRGSEALDGTGNRRSNSIRGNDADNVLKGEGGEDTLRGGTGDDRLYGGTNVDTLLGGTGADGFYFEELVRFSGFADYVNDFSSAEDTVFLDRAAFTQIGVGVLDAESFAIGVAAQEADDRIIYDPESGHVIYDSDGSGGGGASGLFMIVTAGTEIDHTDFIGYG